eukprot:1054376-Amphidinium_carterae.1
MGLSNQYHNGVLDKLVCNECQVSTHSGPLCHYLAAHAVAYVCVYACVICSNTGQEGEIGKLYESPCMPRGGCYSAQST